MASTKRSEVIHDRLAEVSPSQQLGLVVDVVQDPYDQAANITVARATRDDPLAGMLARGQIDRAKYEAGRIWQRHWENAAIGGTLKGCDTTREPVDGRGQTPDPFTDRQRAAVQKLREATVALGYNGDRIIRMVLADRMSIIQVADVLKRHKKYIGVRFRECLETLAKLWSLVSNPHR